MSQERPPPRKGGLFSRPTSLSVPLSPFGRVQRPLPPPMEPADEPTVRRPRRVPVPEPLDEPPPPAPSAQPPHDDGMFADEPTIHVPLSPAELPEEATIPDSTRGDVAPEADPADLTMDEGETLREVRFEDVVPEEVNPEEATAEFEVPRVLASWERRIVPVVRPVVKGRFGGANPPGRVSTNPVAAPTPSGPPLPPAGLTTVSPGDPVVVPPVASTLPTSPTPPAQVEFASATAPGKIILLGEHAVVYGHRAIAAAVDLGTTVTVRRRPGPSRVEDTPLDDPRLGIALASVVPAEGVGVTIRTTLPVGCGMGSSAALAVATIRALARLEGREASLRECVDRGFAFERVFHGNPSGLDHTVSASGGALLYRRGEAAEELKIARPLRLVIANTGIAGDTAEMVARVRQRNPTELLTRIGALVEMTAVRLARGEPISEFVREGHRMLRLIGVSTLALDELCRAMESAGSTGAKLAGAGGGGIVIALVDERSEDSVRRAAASLAAGGVWTTTIGGART